MQTFKQQVFLTCLIFIFTGCASFYKPIAPQKLSYQNSNSQNGIELAYKYDVLRESGNRKYAKREFRHNLNVVALRITNNTDTTIVLGGNVALFAGSVMINPVSPYVMKKTLQQSVLGYSPYLLFFPFSFFYDSGSTRTTLNIGPLLALGLTGGNMLVAGTSNNAFYKELKLYNLVGMEIQKGETKYGIIGIEGTVTAPLKIIRISKE